tara:strand:- start:1042 stop:1209 length:168 start_codon:yes stop_codon:yes gene_type:complete
MKQQLKQQKCVCCKQLGHLMDECPRDPNYKTNHDFKDEQARLMKIKNIKKIFADT